MYTIQRERLALEPATSRSTAVAHGSQAKRLRTAASVSGWTPQHQSGATGGAGQRDPRGLVQTSLPAQMDGRRWLLVNLKGVGVQNRASDRQSHQPPRERER